MGTRRPQRRQGRVEGGGDRGRVEDGTTPRRRANREVPPLASLSREGMVSHQRRRDETGAHTEGRISTRTRARTRAAARTGEQTSRHPPGASPPQQALEQMTPPAPQLGPTPALTVPSSGMLLPPQPGQGILRSSAATRLGPPPTPTLPTGQSRVPVKGPLLLTVETASPPPELRSPIPPVQPRTSCGAFSSTGTQSREEGGLETVTVRTPPPPPLMVPAAVQELDPS